MSVDIRRVSYAWNSALENQGQPGYFLDVYVSRDGLTLVDLHNTFTTREDLLTAMEEVIPVLQDDLTDRPEPCGNCPQVGGGSN